jgi:hypothetical protein
MVVLPESGLTSETKQKGMLFDREHRGTKRCHHDFFSSSCQSAGSL